MLNLFCPAILIMRMQDAHLYEATNMLPIFDRKASKKPTNVSVNSDLLAKAREQTINLSATLERALESELRKTARENWLKDNKNAIDSLNQLVEQNGLFSDKYRDF